MRKSHLAFKRRNLTKYFSVVLNNDPSERLIFKAKTINAVKRIIKDWTIKDYTITEFKAVDYLNNRSHYLSVGDLRKTIESLPADMAVIYERVNDKFFINNDWSIVPIFNSLQAPSYDEYVIAWGAFVDCDKKYLCISAHY